jgi:hypothetical protein
MDVTGAPVIIGEFGADDVGKASCHKVIEAAERTKVPALVWLWGQYWNADDIKAYSTGTRNENWQPVQIAPDALPPLDSTYLDPPGTVIMKAVDFPYQSAGFQRYAGEFTFIGVPPTSGPSTLEVSNTFTGASTRYDMVIEVMAENDGECVVTVLVDNTQAGEYRNSGSMNDFGLYITFEDIAVEEGSEITVRSRRVGTACARWKQIKFVPTEPIVASLSILPAARRNSGCTARMQAGGWRSVTLTGRQAESGRPGGIISSLAPRIRYDTAARGKKGVLLITR